ncbi:putative non-specific serine/threonine protein kinase [Helianthus annuus]|nr:putative non-specific serine/threonine protein kinase [Helianthus annuus]
MAGHLGATKLNFYSIDDIVVWTPICFHSEIQPFQVLVGSKPFGSRSDAKKGSLYLFSALTFYKIFKIFTGNVEFGETAAGFESLEMLDLSSNSFSGVIPSSIGNFSRLVVLNMSSNSLVGSVPSSLGGLKAANVIDLSHNSLNGSILNEIGGAGLLEELRLENNFFIGSIPDQIQNLSDLITL